MDKYTCKKCKKERDIQEFSIHKGCKLGVDISACKPCKRSERDWASVPIERRIYNRIKHRASKNKIEFNLELGDIIIPSICPILGKPFIYADNSWTYSLDRIDPTKGYIKGNIQVLSNRANMLKNDATIEELELILKHLKGGNCEV